MALNSYEFVIVFLPITLLGYFLIQHYASRVAGLRWLLLMSVLFYVASGVTGTIVIGLSILADYAAARLFLNVPPTRETLRQATISGAIALNIIVLCYFKYLTFLLGALSIQLPFRPISPSTYLPLGLSFLTFQKIGFLTDLRSGQIKEVRLFDFTLFGIFFPKAVAGPIIRYKDFALQLRGDSAATTPQDIAVGACLLAGGLFKETIVASIAGQFVSWTFEPRFFNEKITLITGWTGAIAYTLQLYFEFSGYSDMALGVARLFGIKLPMNFNSPLKARSLVDFWARWHITLTRFLTWQIYIPMVRALTRARIAAKKSVLSGPDSKVPAMATLIGLPTFFTMTLSGLWHGAGWHYVLWGAAHGACLTVNQVWRLIRGRVIRYENAFRRTRAVFGRILTLFVVICALVLFRADDTRSAVAILQGMLGLNGVLPHVFQISMAPHIETSLAYETFLSYWYPVLCLISLSLFVVLSPNSLELLRNYKPALDFPSDSGGGLVLEPEQTREIDIKTPRSTPARTLFHRLIMDFKTGMPLNTATALLYAILLVLGTSAISRSGPFIYGQF